MEDSRRKNRIRKFISFKQEEPKKKREEFLVNLRKKRKFDKFNENRKLLIIKKEEIKGTSNSLIKIIPNFFKLQVIERIEVLIQKFLSSENDSEIQFLLEAMVKIVNEQWKSEYENIFMNKDVVNRLLFLWKRKKLELRELVLEYLSNLWYQIKFLLNDLAAEIVNIGLFSNILDWLKAPEVISDSFMTLLKPSIAWLNNLADCESSLLYLLYDSNIFWILSSILKSLKMTLNSDEESKLINFLLLLIESSSNTQIPALKPLLPFLESILSTSTNSNTLISTLSSLNFLLKLSPTFFVSSQIPLVSPLLTHPFLPLRLKALEVTEKLARHWSSEHTEMLKIVKGMGKFLLHGSGRVRGVGLSVVRNLVVEFEQGAKEVITETALVYAIYNWLGNKDRAVGLLAMETLGVVAQKASYEEICRLVEDGMLSYWGELD
jgi:hypothetical protein